MKQLYLLEFIWDIRNQNSLDITDILIYINIHNIHYKGILNHTFLCVFIFVASLYAFLISVSPFPGEIQW